MADFPPDPLILENKTVAAAKQGVLDEKLDRYSRHHRRALEMAKFLQGVYPDRAENLRTCGSFLQFHDYYELGELRLIGAKFCQQDKLCPFCACRRAGKFLRKYVEKLQALTREDAFLIPWFVTVTVKNGVELVERVDHLLTNWRAMIQRRRNFNKFIRGAKYTELVKAEGAVFSVEVKRGSGSGLWHPHLHGVWLCHEKPLEDLLCSEWKDQTGDSDQCDVRQFDWHKLGLEGDWETVAGDFCEVFKYALKFGDMSLEDNLEAWQSLHGKRLVDSFGCFRGVEVDASLTDPVAAEDLPYIEILCRFSGRSMAYEVHQESFVSGAVLELKKQTQWRERLALSVGRQLRAEKPEEEC